MGEPAFVKLDETRELAERASRARESLRSCKLCPRECEVDRVAGEIGFCRAGATARVYRHMVHGGEEPAISGTGGSGTIFLSHCTMRCRYCQNHRMSQGGEGTDRSVDELADMIGWLARAGCHNVNYVSPTQFLPHILESLEAARRSGDVLPVVWNTSGYESQFALELLDGVVDVYLADIRYTSNDVARELSDAPDYVEVSEAALEEMQRQVGTLELDEDGIARRGLIVRHLVLPGGRSGTPEAMRFVAERLGRDTYVSLMSQYYPAYVASGIPGIDRRITRREWAEAVDALEEAGLANGWIQQYPDGLSPIAGTEIDSD
jgi:putative pyruvate formate lyase activating enzyme